MRQLLVCLVDPNAKRLLPSALEACAKMGINADDLREKHVNDFYPAEENENGEEIALMRHQNYEKRRRKKMMLVVEFMREAGEDVKGPYRNFASGVKTSLSHVIRSSLKRPSSAHPRNLLSEKRIDYDALGGDMQYRAIGQAKNSAAPTIETALNQENQIRIADAVEKEQIKLVRLQSVNNNLLNKCKKEVDTIDQIKKRTLKQQQAAYDQKRDTKFQDVSKKNEITQRRNYAKKYLREKDNIRARNSMRYYQTYQKEACDRKLSVAAHDRVISAADFQATIHDYRRTSMPESGLWNSPGKEKSNSPSKALQGLSPSDGNKSPSPDEKSKSFTRAKDQQKKKGKVDSTAKLQSKFKTQQEDGMTVKVCDAEKPLHLDLSKTSKGRPQSAFPIPTRLRNATAYRLNLTYDEKKGRKRDQEDNIKEMLGDIDERLLRAEETQNMTLLAKQIQGSRLLMRGDDVVQKKQQMAEKTELNTLNNYVMAGRKLNDNMSELTTNKSWGRQVIKEKYKLRRDKVEDNKLVIKKREETRRRSLMKKCEMADQAVEYHKNKIDNNVGLRKELEALKQAETNENAEIARAVRTFQKRQLIDKQLEVNKQQSIFKEHQANLAKQIFANDRERARMMLDRHHQVKYIKEHYLNQMEALEGKRQAQMAKQAAADEQEAAAWTLDEEGGTN